MTEPRSRIEFDLLMLMLLIGSTGAPLVGPLREAIQAELGISRAALGFGVFVMGFTAGLIGLLLVAVLRMRMPRTAYVRIGTPLIVVGMLSLALGGALGRRTAAAILAFGWFVLLLGTSLSAMANALIMDLWRARPHAGLILLHAANGIGKIAAPLVVLIVGVSLTRSALIYAGLVGILFVDMLLWPRAHLGALTASERRDAAEPHLDAHGAANPHFWISAALIAFISGSEAGVVSILGSFVTRLRPSPLASLDQGQWAAAVLVIAQLGIPAGRFIFFRLARRLSERRIVFVCIAFTAFVAPSVLMRSPWGYVPSLMLLTVAFSATWPAYFALCARRYRARRGAWTMALTLFNLCGVNGGILAASLIGNRDAGLAPAMVVSALSILLPGLYVAVFLRRPPADSP